MSMEVASPLNISPTPGGGAKRPFAFAPVDSNVRDTDMAEEHHLRSAKRRKFQADEPMESLSSAFSLHSPFQNQNGTSLFSGGTSLMKRSRAENIEKDLTSVVAEQRILIESLRSEKDKLESSFKTLKTENDRSIKENQLLRRAITIQEERRSQAEKQAREEHQYRLKAEQDMKKMEQVIMSLRYHLQTQQSSNMGNDFMGMPPSHPDVF